jgi:hydrogenase 3 maturation protease
MELHKIDAGTRVALLGIGDVLRGDDAVGPTIARALGAMRNDWLVIDAGVCPEAYTGVLRRFRPELVVFVDAVDMGQAPGHSAWFSSWESNELSAATHGFALEVLADYLRAELGCETALLGIQPSSTELGPVSAPVRAAAQRILRALKPGVDLA